MKTLLLLSVCCLAAGCSTVHDTIITSTATTLGVEVAQNPTTQLYQAKLGYSRAEIAFVPTDKGTNQPGAANTGNVMFELRLRNIFAGGGVYQRLAIGKDAVSQPGAAYLFAKDQDGNISTNTASFIKQSLPLLMKQPENQTK